MKVYIKKGFDGEFANHNFFMAYHGFNQMGWEICPYKNITEIETDPEDIVVDFIHETRTIFNRYGINFDTDIDYPDELQNYLGRKIWTSKINDIANAPDSWNIFVKSKKTKKITGRVVKSLKDLRGCGDINENSEVWCSEPVELIAEWRCFVRYKNIIDVRRYKGDWRVNFDYKVIESALNDYKSIPNGCALDFGLTKDNRTILIEVNDDYSLGNYGLISVDYAKLLSARWAEIMGVEDQCNF